jgi:hypothetical protein
MERAKLDAYYNLNDGSGRIRGVYLHGNDMVRPIFEQWLAACSESGNKTRCNVKAADLATPARQAD